MKLKYINEPIVYYKDGGVSELDGKKHSYEEIQIINRHLNHVLKNNSMLINYPREFIYLFFKYIYLFSRCLLYCPILQKTDSWSHVSPQKSSNDLDSHMK